MVDTVPRFDRVFTEDRLDILAEGLAVTELPDLKPWPTNLTTYYSAMRTDSTINGGIASRQRNNSRHDSPRHPRRARPVSQECGL